METMRLKFYVGTFHAAICLMSEAYCYYSTPAEKGKKKQPVATTFCTALEMIVYNYK
jgi:hypothetical protein